MKMWTKALRELNSSKKSNKNAMDIYKAFMKLYLSQYIHNGACFTVTLDLQPNWYINRHGFH